MTTKTTATPPTSKTAAINAMCKGCIYDPMAAGTWREQTAACASGNCPLHQFRPMPRNVSTPEDVAALRQRLDAADRRHR